MTPIRLLLVVFSLFSVSATASAQAPPFFGGGTGIFDPEIDVINSGILLDAQVAVSADRKYVTMTTRTSQTELLAIREFAFQVGGGGTGSQGFVGGAGQSGVGGAVASPRVANERAAAAPGPGGAATQTAQRPVRPSVLDKEGMTLVGRVGEPGSARRRAGWGPPR